MPSFVGSYKMPGAEKSARERGVRLCQGFLRQLKDMGELQQALKQGLHV